jgi:hypothetical protein
MEKVAGRRSAGKDLIKQFAAFRKRERKLENSRA